jgi:hypothetical protein
MIVSQRWSDSLTILSSSKAGTVSTTVFFDVLSQPFQANAETPAKPVSLSFVDSSSDLVRQSSLLLCFSASRSGQRARP